MSKWKYRVQMTFKQRLTVFRIQLAYIPYCVFRAASRPFKRAIDNLGDNLISQDPKFMGYLMRFK